MAKDYAELRAAILKNLDGLRYEKRDTTAIVTLDRPQSGNSLTPSMRDGIVAIWHDVANDPAVRAVRARVAFQEDATVPIEAAIVELHLADGTILSEHVRHGRGTPGRPMSDAELDAKVADLVAFGAPFVDAPALIAAIRGIENAGDVSQTFRLAVPK